MMMTTGRRPFLVMRSMNEWNFLPDFLSPDDPKKKVSELRVKKLHSSQAKRKKRERNPALTAA